MKKLYSPGPGVIESYPVANSEGRFSSDMSNKIPRHIVKPVLSDHSKIDKTKILMTNCSLMKVESIAVLQYNTFDLH